MSDQTRPQGKPAPVRDKDLEVAQILLDEGDAQSKKVMTVAAIIAIVFHAAVLFFQITKKEKEIAVVTPRRVVKVKKYRPIVKQPEEPPPPPEVKRPEKVSRVPLPDPTPDEPEPVVEPEPEIDLPPIPPDAIVEIGIPDAPPPDFGPDMYTVGLDIGQPELITRVEPEYPRAAKAVGAQGQVILKVIIDEDGNVTDINVLKVKPSPGLGFEDEAKKAVAQWKYKPSVVDGRKVAVQWRFTVHFRLNG